MLLQLAVGRHQLVGRDLRLRGRFDQHLHAFLDLAERLGAILELFDALDDLIELARGGGGFLIDLLERFPELRQLRAAHGNLREHRAERAALFSGGGYQPLEIVGLFLHLSTAGPPSLWSGFPPRPFGRAAIAFASRFAIPGSTSLRIASPSTSHPPTCERRGRRSTCRSRLACSPRPACSPRARSMTRSSWGAL